MMKRFTNSDRFPYHRFRPTLVGLPLGIMACFALVWPQELRADWAWKTDQSDAPLIEDHLVAEFVFHNTGTKAVAVKELQFACSCTEYSFKATPAEAGGDGTLRIFLAPGSKGTTLEVVVFGSEDTTPTPLKIQISKQVKSLPKP